MRRRQETEMQIMKTLHLFCTICLCFTGILYAVVEQPPVGVADVTAAEFGFHLRSVP